MLHCSPFAHGDNDDGWIICDQWDDGWITSYTLRCNYSFIHPGGMFDPYTLGCNVTISE